MYMYVLLLSVIVLGERKKNVCVVTICVGLSYNSSPQGKVYELLMGKQTSKSFRDTFDLSPKFVRFGRTPKSNS